MCTHITGGCYNDIIMTATDGNSIGCTTLPLRFKPVQIVKISEIVYQVSRNYPTIQRSLTINLL